MTKSGGKRMRTEAITSASVASFAEDVRAGLSQEGQKELLSKYLYDEMGSALFEVICLLPEYGLTRAGERLLKEYSDEITSHLPAPVIAAELGSGTGRKTRWILQALRRRQAVDYYPIEISAAALERCHQELGDMDRVSVVGFEREYLEGLLEVVARRQAGEHLLVLFLGSTIGNFDRPAAARFLRQVREILQTGDALLLATDLMKPLPTMVAAYDDGIGVTAAFNLNLLARVNRELQGDFDLSRFKHLILFDPEKRRIELHLRSTEKQTVQIEAAGLTVELDKDETIWTESSHKFTLDEIVGLAESTGFRCDNHWVDHDWPYAQNLLIAD